MGSLQQDRVAELAAYRYASRKSNVSQPHPRPRRPATRLLRSLFRPETAIFRSAPSFCSVPTTPSLNPDPALLFGPPASAYPLPPNPPRPPARSAEDFRGRAPATTRAQGWGCGRRPGFYLMTFPVWFQVSQKPECPKNNTNFSCSIFGVGVRFFRHGNSNRRVRAVFEKSGGCRGAGGVGETAWGFEVYAVLDVQGGVAE